jgi:acyl-homoserine-lactone acylase
MKITMLSSTSLVARTRRWLRICSATSLAAGLLAGCGGSDDDRTSAPAPKFSATVTTTRYGIPHVKADDFGSLGYGVAQAYMKQNFCLLADQVVTVNGERSMHFGPAAQTLVSFVPVANRDADFFYKAYLDDAALESAFASAPPEVKELLAGYIEGYNDYVEAKPATGAAPRNPCDGQPWVRPITQRDFLRLLGDKAILASGAAFAKAIVSAQPPAGPISQVASRKATRRLDKDVVLAQLNPYYTRGVASNAYALGKQGTGTGAGMLLGNPHWPWFGTSQFFEIHMTVPGRFDAFGVMNGDLPVPLIGFNKDVAWTHTVSPTLRQSIYELKLSSSDPTHYVVDGQDRAMTARQITIKEKAADGKVTDVQRTVWFSHLGPMLSVDSLVPGGVNLRWTSTTAYTLRDANLNSVRTLEQWLRIGQARSVAEIKSTLRSVSAIPYVHTIAADRDGNALFADIGPTPNLDRSQVVAGPDSCVRGATAQAVLSLLNLPILDGSRAACDWKVDATAPRAGLMPTASLPAVDRQDFVANSNQSAWFVNPQARIDDLHPILGGAQTPLTLRQRLAQMQIEERMAGTDGLPGTGFGNLELLQKVLYGHRLLAAELSIPGKGSQALTTSLTSTCAPAAGETTRLVAATNGTLVDIAPACLLLASTWDGRSNLESRGAVLFREFWRRLRMPAGTRLWLKDFDLADPVHTPRDLNTEAGVALDTLRRTLADTVLDLTTKGVDYTRALGELQSVTRAGQRIPLPGGDEFEGTFNKLTMKQNNTTVPLTAAGYTDVFVGSSFIQAVTWVNGTVQARGVLAYSQSSDPASAHFADQTAALFSAKQFAILPFSDAEIAAERVGEVEQIASKKTK